MALTRQLSAIMFVDIVGYTAMMEEDEILATRAREKFLLHVQQEMSAHRGRIYDLRGDGALCGFSSASEAVRAAIGIQRNLQASPVVPVRIGIHQGELKIDEHELIGGVVNIASRIESFSSPGSILISGKVYDDIRNQKEFQTTFLGKYKFKNVGEAVDLYAIDHPEIKVPRRGQLQGKGILDSNKKARSWIASLLFLAVASAFSFFLLTRSDDTEEHGLQPSSLAVQYFENMSSDPNTEYFSEGITDEITSTIAQIDDLRVISRSTMSHYKGKDVDLKQMADDLKVNSILEGSVRLEGKQFKIAARLINAHTGAYMWSDTYDGMLENIIDVQQSIALQIAKALQIRITENTKNKISEVPTRVPEAYDDFQKGKYILYQKYFNTHEESDFMAAREYFKKAIALDPSYADPYAGLAELYDELRNQSTVFNKNGIPEYPGFPDSLATAKLELARKAVRLNPTSPFVLTAMAWAVYHRKDGPVDSCLYYLEKAYRLAPDIALHASNIASILCDRFGLMEEAMPFVEQALKTDPLDPNLYCRLGEIHLSLGHEEEARKAFKTTLDLANGPINREFPLLMSLIYLDEKEIVRERLKNNTAADSFAVAVFHASMGEAESIPVKYKNDPLIMLILHPDQVRKDVLQANEKLLQNYVINIFNTYNNMKHSRYFDAYRNDPTFKQLLQKAKIFHDCAKEKYKYLRVIE